MIYRKITFLLVLLLIVNGCTTYHGLKTIFAPLSGDELLQRYKKIELEMSERKVIRLMGSPHSVRSDLGRWNYPIKTSKYSRIQVYFVDGKASGKRKYAGIDFEEGFGVRPPNLSDEKWNKKSNEIK